MTLFRTLNNAVSGLNTITDSIAVASDNISNAQNENYHRRTVAVEDDPHSGTRIAQVVRETNVAMQRVYRGSLSRHAASEVRNNMYSEIADVLGSSEGTSRLSTVMGEFISGWRELQTAPENEAVAFKIESAALEMASLVREIAEETELMRQEINASINQDIQSLNSLIEELADLNGQVISYPLSSSARAAFENDRDQVLDDISKIVEISVQRNGDDTFSVYTKTGINLLGGISNVFDWDATEQKLGSIMSTRNLVDELPEGSLRARIMLVREYNDAAVGNLEASDPNTSPIQKLQDQLDAVVQLLTQPSDSTSPTTFAGAFGAAFDNPVEYPGDYSQGDAPYIGYWRNQLFVPSDMLSEGATEMSARNFYVNADLIQDLREIATNSPAIGTIVSNLTSHSRDMELRSLSLENQSYEDVIKAVQVNFSVRNERVYSLHNANMQSHTQVRTNYRSAVGVSLDVEMARITVLQNSYVATAKVISTVNNMFTTLERAV